MKKIVLGVLTVALLMGCANSSTSNDMIEETQAEIEAKQLVSVLDMDLDTMSRVKDRVVRGMVLSGDKTVTTDACMYRSNEDGNYDTVGVFYTEDMELLSSYLNSYLDYLKSEVNQNYPQEVFKISNAIIDNNDDTLILVITTNIESAKVQVNNILFEGESE